VICPGKIRTDDWVAAMEGAMAAGLDVTSTMMYGHVETVEHRAKHLGVIRDLQDRTGRITEFVPSPLSTRTRPSTATALSTPAPHDEDELVVAVARLFLDNVDHVQASWVKSDATRTD